MAARRVIIEFLGQDKTLGKTMGGIEGKTSALAGKFSQFGKAAAAGFAILGAAAIKGGVDAIGAASDLNETLSKSRVIFGKHAKDMEDWADRADTSLGLSKAAALGLTSGFADMFNQIGFGGTKAAQMSVQVAQLSADLGSFNNLETADVADRMSAAFRGEYDSLQALIPNINAARVESVAMAQSGKDTAAALTAQEKAAAVLAIVHKDGAKAQGDFAKTSGSLANQQKILKAQFSNVQAEIGQKFLPVAVKLFNWLNADVLPAARRFGGYLQSQLPPIFARLRSAVSSVMSALAPFGEWIKSNPKTVKVFAIILGGLAVAIGVVTVAMAAFSAVLATTGIPLLIIGIAALAAGLYYAYQKSETFRAVIAKVGAAFTYLMGEAKKLLPAIRSTFADAVSIAKSALAGLKVAFSVALNVIQGVWSKFGGNILQFLTSTLENVKTVLSGAFTVIRGIFKTVSSLLKGDWKGVWDGIKMILRGAVTALVGIVKQLGNLLRFAFKNIGTALKALMRGIWTGIKAIISNGAQGIVNAVKAIPGRLAGLGRLFANAGKGLLQGFINGMKNAAGIITGIAGNVWDAVKRLLNGAIEKINRALEFRIDKGPVNIGINPPDIPKLAKGGIVQKRPGGILANIGEGRYDEAVVPLDPATKRALAGGGSGGGDERPLVVQLVLPGGQVIEQLLIKRSRETGRPIQVRTLGAGA